MVFDGIHSNIDGSFTGGKAEHWNFSIYLLMVERGRLVMVVESKEWERDQMIALLVGP